MEINRYDDEKTREQLKTKMCHYRSEIKIHSLKVLLGKSISIQGESAGTVKPGYDQTRR